MMLLLGEYRFSVDTAAYQSKNRTTTYRWGKQDRIGTEPWLQFVGPGDDTINIEGVIYPHYKGGLSQLEQMRVQAATGRPLLLAEGTGKILGGWVIESITENETEFTKDGIPKRVSFTLELRKSETAKSVNAKVQRILSSQSNGGSI